MKIKIILLTSFVLVLYGSYCNSQDLIDPYKNYTGQNINDISYPSPLVGYYATNPNSFLFRPNSRDTRSCISYDGEYNILLEEMPWARFGGGFSDLYSNYKSYSIEVVSFPFTIPCWDQPGGCASPGYSFPGIPNPRILSMPDDNSYDLITKKWDHLARYYESDFELGQQPGTNVIGPRTVKASTLVTRLFLQDEPPLDPNVDGFLPHSILKHTVYFHCTDQSNSNVVFSISWYYDNTRGQMRRYPFKGDNTVTGTGCHNWDVVFRPEILIDPDDTNLDQYLNTSNSSWISGGSINYFPFSESNNSACSTYDPTLTTHFANGFSQNPNDNSEIRSIDHQNPYPPPFSIQSNLLRDVNAEHLAGYIVTNDEYVERPGLFQTYTINRAIDLTRINPIKKVIYNPSVVIVDPNYLNLVPMPPFELLFPDGYTFKTLLGRYPSIREVEDANSEPQNGGPYLHLNDVPVPVDAPDWPHTTTLTEDYPEVMWDDPLTTDPNGFYNDEKFGYYKIFRNAQVTIQNCVNLFDARFSVHNGGVFEFTNYPGIIQTEDKDNNRGRYKIRGEGGAILRNFAPAQFVQNGQIDQSQPLVYIATSVITSGSQVDPDTEQPTGEYNVLPGADVTFKSGSYIYLNDGFYVSGGTFHAYIEENMAVPDLCMENTRIMSPTLDQLPSNNGNFRSSGNFKVAPNPTIDHIQVSGFLKKIKGKIRIVDLIGKEILSYNINADEAKVEFDLSKVESGIYFIQITYGNSYDTLKIVKE